MPYHIFASMWLWADMTFHQLVFSNCSLERMLCYILSRHVAFHWSGNIHVFSKCSFVRMPCQNLSNYVAFHQCELFHVFTKYFCMRILCHILSRHVAFLQCGSIHVFFSNSHFPQTLLVKKRPLACCFSWPTIITQNSLKAGEVSQLLVTPHYSLPLQLC